MRQLKHLIIVLTVAVSIASAAYGEVSEADFATANSLYERGEFKQALEMYQTLEEDVENWKVQYNIGNCYFKLNKPLLAKIHYLRAQRLKPFEPSIEKNLGVVDRLFKDAVPPEKPDFVEGVFMRLEAAVTLDVVSWLLLLSVVGLNIFIFIWLLRGRTKIVSYGVAVFLILAVILSFYHVVRVSETNKRDVAVVISPETVLRSGPGENNTILFKVNPGLKVRIIERSKDWCQVTASAQIAGWIKVDALTVI